MNTQKFGRGCYSLVKIETHAKTRSVAFILAITMSFGVTASKNIPHIYPTHILLNGRIIDNKNVT